MKLNSLKSTDKLGNGDGGGKDALMWPIKHIG